MTWGSAHATPPYTQVPGFFLSLLLQSRATESSWFLCPRGPLLQQAQGGSSQALCAPEVPACQEASPGTWENVSLLRAPWGCCPGCSGWRQGGGSAGRGGLQLDGEEGSFHLLLLRLFSHFLQGGRAGSCQGRVSDLSAQGCECQQLWADTSWPHGSTDSLRKQTTHLQHPGGVFKEQGECWLWGWTQHSLHRITRTDRLVGHTLGLRGGRGQSRLHRSHLGVSDGIPFS